MPGLGGMVHRKTIHCVLIAAAERFKTRIRRTGTGFENNREIIAGRLVPAALLFIRGRGSFRAGAAGVPGRRLGPGR